MCLKGVMSAEAGNAFVHGILLGFLSNVIGWCVTNLLTDWGWQLIEWLQKTSRRPGSVAWKVAAQAWSREKGYTWSTVNIQGLACSAFIISSLY